MLTYLGMFFLGSKAWSEDEEHMQRIWSSVKGPMFSLDDREKQLGLGSKGVSTYFTPNCNQVRNIPIIFEKIFFV